jgi:hypothetical protein
MLRNVLFAEISVFAGILQAPQTSSKLSYCRHTAEVAGSNPVSPANEDFPYDYARLPLAVCSGMLRPNWGMLQVGHRHWSFWEDSYGGVFADSLQFLVDRDRYVRDRLEVHAPEVVGGYLTV